MGSNKVLGQSNRTEIDFSVKGYSDWNRKWLRYVPSGRMWKM